MFRTVKVKLPFEQSLVQTAVAFNKACQTVLDYGSEHKTFNKDKLTGRRIVKSVKRFRIFLQGGVVDCWDMGYLGLCLRS